MSGLRQSPFLHSPEAKSPVCIYISVIVNTLIITLHPKRNECTAKRIIIILFDNFLLLEHLYMPEVYHLLKYHIRPGLLLHQKYM